MREEVFGYIARVIDKLEAKSMIVGGHKEHAHILASLGRTITIAEFVKEVKRVSSIWLKDKGGMMQKFTWQRGYSAYTVSLSNVPAVRKYIETQEEHHRTVSFQDEYRRFLKIHGVEWDERYVWD